MNELKTLYKMARNILFYKDYKCIHCGIVDFDKYYMRQHVKTCHDERMKEVRRFNRKNAMNK